MIDSKVKKKSVGTVKQLTEYERVGQTPEDPQGWYKIMLNEPGSGLKKSLKVSIKENEDGEGKKMYCYIAVSGEPRWTK